MSEIMSLLDWQSGDWSLRQAPVFCRAVWSEALLSSETKRQDCLAKARPAKHRGFFFGASRRAATQRVSLSYVTSGREPGGSVLGSRKARCNSYNPRDWLHSEVWGPRERHRNPRKGLDSPLLFKLNAWGRGRLLAGFPTARGLDG